MAREKVLSGYWRRLLFTLLIEMNGTYSNVTVGSKDQTHPLTYLLVCCIWFLISRTLLNLKSLFLPNYYSFSNKTFCFWMRYKMFVWYCSLIHKLNTLSWIRCLLTSQENLLSLNFRQLCSGDRNQYSLSFLFGIWLLYSYFNVCFLFVSFVFCIFQVKITLFVCLFFPYIFAYRFHLVLYLINSWWSEWMYSFEGAKPVFVS